MLNTCKACNYRSGCTTMCAEAENEQFPEYQQTDKDRAIEEGKYLESYGD